MLKLLPNGLDGFSAGNMHSLIHSYQMWGLLLGFPAPGPFVAAPAVPVSDSSPFNQLANGPSTPSNKTEFTTFWRCGDFVMDTFVYHSLTLAIENGLCLNNTALDGLYDCGQVSIDQSAYSALVTGTANFRHPTSQIGCLMNWKLSNPVY